MTAIRSMHFWLHCMVYKVTYRIYWIKTGITLMQTSIYIFFALLIGAISAIYLPMNSSVSRYLGSPLTANISFYIVALVTSLVLFAFLGDFNTLNNIKSVPPYLYLTGFVSAFIVLAITFLIPILGARKLVILSIAGQLIMAMIVSHFGVLESPRRPDHVEENCRCVFIDSGRLRFGELTSKWLDKSSTSHLHVRCNNYSQSRFTA